MKATLLLGVLTACSAADASDEPYVWQLPNGVEPPPESARNRTTRAKVELGSLLFAETRLSATGQYSCATCHQPDVAFSDPRVPSLGLYGEELPRQSPSLLNVGYLGVYTWSNPHLTSLEGQALVPLLARRPAELDLGDRTDRVLDQLVGDSSLVVLFQRAFPSAAELGTLTQVTDALAAYQRTLISANSPYDRHLAGAPGALGEAAERGRMLFFSEGLGCGQCHQGRWLSDAAESLSSPEAAFHNTGLYNLDANGAYPRQSPGLIELTGHPDDRGKFRTPPLRNLTVTAPFMHDGSVATLDAVIDHYAAGGRSIESGPYAGFGSRNPNKDPRVAGFALSARERADLLSFLENLTDDRFAGTAALPSTPFGDTIQP